MTLRKAKVSGVSSLSLQKISSIAMAEGTLSGVLGKTEVWALRKQDCGKKFAFELILKVCTGFGFHFQKGRKVVL